MVIAFEIIKQKSWYVCISEILGQSDSLMVLCNICPLRHLKNNYLLLSD